MSTSSGSKVEGREEVAYEDHIRYSTFGGTSGSMALAATTAVCSEEHIKALQEKAAKAR
jgi:predicted ATP-dependent Lon-type protease